MMRENYQIEFGKRLKFYRERANLSQDELARVCGYSGRSAISRIEKGERDLRIDLLKPVSFALGVSPMVFFDDNFEENNIMETNLLSTFRQLPDNSKEDALQILSTFGLLSFRGREDMRSFSDYQLQRELNEGKKEGKDQPVASEE